MSQAMPTEHPSSATDPLGDPALRRSLSDFVRRRVPAAEVDDVVQTVLVDALAAPNRPTDAAELRRWVLGIARHKVVDFHRRATREPPTELPDIEVSPEPIEARALARWAEEQAGSARDAQKTLAWMAREGEGEKLEAIAADEQVPAARVRQRVSRMRRWMKERWSAELAAVAMLALLAIAAWWILRRDEAPTTDKGPYGPPTIVPEPPSPLERARALRAEAMDACGREAWRLCLDGLDRARGLDPEGDRAPAIGAARAKAEEALRATPQTSAAPTAAPQDAPPQQKAPAPAPTTKSTAPSEKDNSIYEKKSKPMPKPFYGNTDSLSPKNQTPSFAPKRPPRKGGGKALKKVLDPEAF
jgi:DNA-directed RNA polymerase specialized sigma24 family protein